MGLEDHMTGCDALPIPAEESPSGHSGILYAWRSKGDDQIIVKKDQQEWMKSEAGYWVGVWKDKMPTEQQLRRTYTQKGVWVAFGANRETWKVPTPQTIDQRLALSDDGSWQYQPIRELAWYGDEVAKIWSTCEVTDVDSNGHTNFVVPTNVLDIVNLLVRVLRINYRITPEVCHMLDMFTKTQVLTAYGLMIDAKFEGLE